MYWIYILYCNDNRFFIGETETIDTTLDQHFLGKYGAFTRKHRPVYLLGLYNVTTNIKYNKYFKRNSYYAKWFVQKLTKDLNLMYNDRIFTNEVSYFKRKMIIENDIEDERPICQCGMLCEIYIEQDADIYWYGCPSWNVCNTCTNVLIQQFTPCYFIQTINRQLTKNFRKQ